MKKIISKIYLAVIFIFLYFPIGVMIFYSFNEPGRKGKVNFNFTGFTLENYKNLLSNSELIGVVINTLVIALFAALFASLLGTCAAIGISNLKNRSRKIVLNISNMPIINPEIVTGVSLMLLFVAVTHALGLRLNAVTVLLSHILFDTPYVILNVLPRIRRMDPSLYEAALDLGCKPGVAFRKVVFPEIFPGIFAGFLMAFTFSIDDFVISYFTGGNFQTLSVYINNSLKVGPKAWMLSLTGILFIIVLTMLIVVNLRERDKEK
ncbi:MAG: ABC transporter permease [Firmicutes bacterium]|nr:ABC transporter permease [Bacillota bacterium]